MHGKSRNNQPLEILCWPTPFLSLLMNTYEQRIVAGAHANDPFYEVVCPAYLRPNLLLNSEAVLIRIIRWHSSLAANLREHVQGGLAPTTKMRMPWAVLPNGWGARGKFSQAH